jgi:hypothetical protein
MRALAAVIAWVSLAACGGWDASARARDRASEVLECTAIELETVRENVWRARGCERETAIACTSGDNEPRCIPVRLGTSGGELASSGARDEGRAVRDAPAEPARDAPSETAIDATETASVGQRDTDRATALAGPSVPPSGLGPRPPVSPAEPALRAAIDERRDDILACVGRDRAVVRFEWTASGPLAITLSGALAGTVEEGCVRAALGDLAAAPGTEGALLHLVRR